MNDFQKSQLAKAQKVAADHGGECLSTEYLNNGAGAKGIKMKWRCAKGHEWEATFTSVVNTGAWCVNCHYERRKDPKKRLEVAKKAAKDRGGECLSAEYINNGTNSNNPQKMLWKCANPDHPAWRAAFNDVVNYKRWCPICGGGWPATIKRAQEKAAENGGLCLSEEADLINAHSILEWGCGNPDHPDWKAAFYNVVINGQWCQVCNRGWPASIKTAKRVAAENGGFCLTDEKANITTNHKILWACEHGHRWTATYGNVVNNGRWCPYCNDSAPEGNLRRILNRILHSNSKKIRPDFLKNPKTGYNLEIDIFFEDLKIAIEYNGEQHDTPKRFSNYNGEGLLKIQKQRDRLKKQLIKKNPDKVEHFIIFTYKDKITEAAVRKKLLKHGIDPDKIYYEQLYRWAL